MTELRDLSGDWPEDSNRENGDYFNQCCLCSRVFVGHKRRMTCKVCAIKLAEGSTNRELYAELATEKANQERLVGEMQELRQVVKEYRRTHSIGHYYPCELCKRSDALLAPKDTPTEPKSAPELEDKWQRR